MAVRAVIGDLHFDVKGGDIDFLEFQINWLAGVLKQCHQVGIKEVIQVGDMLDRRKIVDVRVCWTIVHRILPLLEQYGITMTIIVGNHNIYYRESNEIHNLWFLEHHPNIRIVKEWGEEGGILYMGWINKNNVEAQMKVVAESKARFCFGHFEFEGFPMYKGVPAIHGMGISAFKKFEKVVTGHYHTVSEIDNVTYVGSPYHLTWADYPDGTNRGWFTFDDTTGSLNLVKNTEAQSLFAIFNYDPAVKYEKKDLEPYANKIVRIVVKDKGDTRRYNNFLALLREIKFIEYKLVDETIVAVKEGGIQIDSTKMVTNTQQVITDYVGKLAGTVNGADPALAQQIAADLYQKANT